MLILNLRGGLGNQIIQIARAEAKDKDFKINSSVSSLNPLLDSYQAKVFNSKIIERIGIVLRFIKSKAKGIRSDFSSFGIMDGYFQAGLNLYDFDDEFLRRLCSTLKSGSTTDLVIHFRGGDYLDEVNKKIFGYMDGDYYKAALARLKEEVDISTFKIRVITNDVPEAESLFMDMLGLSFDISSSSEIEDFTAIFNSKYAIIPNSTFSLMARVLAIHAKIDCKTVYPYQWFTKQSQMVGPVIKEFDRV